MELIFKIFKDPMTLLKIKIPNAVKLETLASGNFDEFGESE